MAGQPSEAMMGVGLVGAGLVLVVAAYKNVSPVALVKRAVTEGITTLEGLPPIVKGKDDGKGTMPTLPDDSSGRSGPVGSMLPDDIQAILAKVSAGGLADPRDRTNNLANFIANGLESASQHKRWDAITVQCQADITKAYNRGYISADEMNRLRAYLEQNMKK